MGKVVLVCGGRDYKDHDCVFRVLHSLHDEHTITAIIHGAAKGADTFAGNWARMKYVKEKPYFAQWHLHGKAAGHIRNKRMLDANPGIDFVIAFPGGKGTANMIKQALEKGIKTANVTETGELQWVSTL